MPTDYTAVTELGGSRLNSEQMVRFAHRYAAAATLTAGRTLEVACGAAIGLGALAASGRPVVGLDYTPTVLMGAQAHYQGRLPLLCADSQRLPVASAAFNAVLCLEAVYYFPDPAAFLAEARRVLAPGGRLLVGSSNPDWPYFVPGLLARSYPTAPELAGWLQAAGFAPVQLYGAVAAHRATARHAAVSQLRQRLLRSPVRPLVAPFAERLKRIVYGQLLPLPDEMPLPMLRHTVATLELEQLPINQPDRVHRVIYALGEASGPS
jgi:ubiquinone/menaquinone biosynthesis C-methylase UbiE